MTDSPKGTALVTGASRGIGYELARLFAATGWDVVLVARSEDDLRAAADTFEERYGAGTTVLSADLSDPDSPSEIYEACEQREIQVDALVNNAGFGNHGNFLDNDLETDLDQVQVNVTALTELTWRFGRDMADRGEGKILNVGSGAAWAPGPRMAVYYASKAYVRNFSEAIAEELRGEGVTVTCLCPGPVETGFQDEADNEGMLLNRFTTQTARSVARAGFRGLQEGDTIVIPGLATKVVLFATRFVPRSVVRTVAKWAHRGA